ncbi:MAG: isochorismatase family cysteine hydrolase, partial [Erysipelotrichaceae bacterium]
MKEYKSIKLNELQEPLVIVVDMVNGFIKEGAMSDLNIMRIVPNIKLLLEKIPSYFIVDKHLEDAIEFKSFPIHCLEGSSESNIIDELSSYNILYPSVYKNSTNAIFAKDRDDEHKFNFDILDKYKSLIIVGCCSDICVLQLAIGLRTYYNQCNKEMDVYVPINCIDTYNAPNYHEAKEYNDIAIK